MPTSTVEDYLKCILLAEQEAPDQPVSTGQIAVALEVAPGTVTAMLKTLARSGLVSYEPYSGVWLTEQGRQLAVHVLRRHRLVELFLVRVMGLDWSEVHDEAELLEHAVSDRIIERMDAMLGGPEVDPHGDPIPTAGGDVEHRQLESLLDCPLDTWLRVARVTDQAVDFLQLVETERLKPGSRIRVTRRDAAADTMQLDRPEAGPLALGLRAASKILVAEDSEGS